MRCQVEDLSYRAGVKRSEKKKFFYSSTVTRPGEGSVALIASSRVGGRESGGGEGGRCGGRRKEEGCGGR